MAKVHFVKKARKAIPHAGIKVGDSYYWWALRMPGSRSGTKRVSKTRPRPSQLTLSEYRGNAYSIEEDVTDAFTAVATKDDVTALVDLLNEKASEVRDLGSEQDDKFSNMPEGLQQGDTGQLLESRRDCCESTANYLESAASEIENIDYEDCDDKAGFTEDEYFVSEAQNIASNISWEWEA